MAIIDRLLDLIDQKQSASVVGLDPILSRIPRHLVGGDTLEDAGDAIVRFNCEIIDSVADIVPAVKPQAAYYEQYGHEGVLAFKRTVDYARKKGLIVIEDAKRNDISSTAQAYADGHIGQVQVLNSTRPAFDVDWLTVNPYLGSDGLEPFVKNCARYDRGIFILVKTSNPSSGELQDRQIAITPKEAKELNERGVRDATTTTALSNLVALMVDRYAKANVGSRGYSPIGAVVGATYPQQATILRKIMPTALFLVPGYGAQGATAKDLVESFNPDGYGAIVNSSRGIIYAYEASKSPERFATAARDAAIAMNLDIRKALKEAKRLPDGWRAA